ncbi:MAG: hypothetical protein OJF50_005199 [Nitrospira sp.]|nr:hypothetical protein [Nitrospira sp.]
MTRFKKWSPALLLKIPFSEYVVVRPHVLPEDPNGSMS